MHMKCTDMNIWFFRMQVHLGLVDMSLKKSGLIYYADDVFTD